MRDQKMDNLKFTMIFLVVFGHVLEMGNIQTGVFNILYTGIYMFHMPIMIIVSGYFSRIVMDRGELGILNRYIKLVIPSLVLQFIFAVLSYMFTGAIQPYWVLWYTVALIVWDYLIDYTKFRYWPILMLLMVLMFGNMGMIANTLFGRIVYFMPFYLIGYYFDLSKLDSLTRSVKSWIVLAATALASIGIFTFVNSGLDYQLFYFSKGYAELGLDMVSGMYYRIVAYVIAFSLSALLFILMSKRAYGYVQSVNTMTIYLLHGLIIRTIGWFLDYELNSMIIAFILSVAIVALTARKRLFSDLFKGVLEWAKQHTQAIHSFRAVSLLIIFAVYGYVSSPVILEAKSQSVKQHYEETLETNESLIPSSGIENPEEADSEVTSIPGKVFEGFNWDQQPSSESKGPLTDIGSVVYDHDERKPRVEYGEVYNMSLDGKYLSYEDQEFVVVEETMNLKIDFIELGQQIGIKLLNGRYLSVLEGYPVIDTEPTPLDYDVRDLQVAFKYKDQYLSIESGELVFVSEQKFWDVELEVIDDSPLTYYSQIDDRWRYDDFAYDNISTRGCGLVSMAMILNYELDSEIDVDDMIALDRQHNLGRSDPPRIDVDRFARIIGDTYEVNVKKIELADIPAEIKSGRLVYYHTSNNPGIGYKNFGHLIVIYGISEDGKLKFLDPYPGNIKQIPADEALQYYGQVFSYGTQAGIRRSDVFTGYITLDAMAKSSAYTSYSIWR
ncbi:acyltransferase family protein [Gudongella sp. SC589]|jgi:fucose 4-O-acetylase-like acetyltransferase|uniref:acyltransferase family protein n=1 Tax=Gudongella sp. SC589 TaxID=3385990 RepID=UPI003904AB80